MLDCCPVFGVNRNVKAFSKALTIGAYLFHLQTIFRNHMCSTLILTHLLRQEPIHPDMEAYSLLDLFSFFKPLNKHRIAAIVPTDVEIPITCRRISQRFLQSLKERTVSQVALHLSASQVEHE